jgi:hypothetical protein
MFISSAFAQAASPPGDSNGLGFGLFVLVGVVLIIVNAFQQRNRQHQQKLVEQREITEQRKQLIIKAYRGSQVEAMVRFQADSTQMAAHGYFPTSQTWAPGQWGTGAFIVALLLCIILIGIIALIYMLIVRPEGTLTVTYERRTLIEEKTCPKCAERIKAAALVCHFCGHEFAPEEVKEQQIHSMLNRSGLHLGRDEHGNELQGMPLAEGDYGGYHYVHFSDGTAALKLSSGRWRRFPTVDDLNAYVDVITR